MLEKVWLDCRKSRFGGSPENAGKRRKMPENAGNQRRKQNYSKLCKIISVKTKFGRPISSVFEWPEIGQEVIASEFFLAQTEMDIGKNTAIFCGAHLCSAKTSRAIHLPIQRRKGSYMATLRMSKITFLGSPDIMPEVFDSSKFWKPQGGCCQKGCSQRHLLTICH